MGTRSSCIRAPALRFSQTFVTTFGLTAKRKCSVGAFSNTVKQQKFLRHQPPLCAGVTSRAHRLTLRMVRERRPYGSNTNMPEAKAPRRRAKGTPFGKARSSGRIFTAVAEATFE